jgi:hypothetical protein
MIRRMRRLLVRLLRPHLSDAALLAFDAEALSRTARRRAVRHLGQCEPCRARLEALRQDLQEIADMFERAASAPEGAGQNWPALLEIIRESQAEGRSCTISPNALRPYLGRLVGSTGAQLPPGRTPGEVLEALLGARAASCLHGPARRRQHPTRNCPRS